MFLGFLERKGEEVAGMKKGRGQAREENEGTHGVRKKWRR